MLICLQDIYSEEFVAQAQAKLDEAMQILSKEDPELWQQLKGFSDAASATLGGEEERGREGERKEEGERGREGERKEGGGSIEETLEDTFRRLKESTEKIEVCCGSCSSRWSVFSAVCVCVCACVRACVRVCVRAYVRVCVFPVYIYVQQVPIVLCGVANICTPDNRLVSALKHCAVLLFKCRSQEPFL